MKYFYIIERDGTTHEIDYRESVYRQCLEKWSQTGVIIVQSKNDDAPKGINGADVKNILGEEEYKNWFETTRPRQYILNGTWYDGKERKLIRHEPWRQKEIDERKKLDSPEGYSEPTEDELKRIEIAKQKIRDKMKWTNDKK